MQPIETGKNNNQSCLNQVQKVRELFMLDCTAYNKLFLLAENLGFLTIYARSG
jgi:hypothetical protein